MRFLPLPALFSASLLTISAAAQTPPPAPVPTQIVVPAVPKQAASPASAAKAAAAASGAKDTYASESFVVTKADWTNVNKADGTGYRQRTLYVHLQSEASLRAFGVVEIPFASASEHVEFHYARVRHPDGSVTETPVSEVIEQPAPVTREAPFYSDLKSAQLPIKNLRVGDTLEMETRVVRTRAEAPNRFWGEQEIVSDDAVALDENVELRVPASMAVNVWTNPHGMDAPKVTTEGDEKVYRWHRNQLKPTTGADAEKLRKERETKVLTAEEETDADQGKLPPIAWTTFASWADVGAWYRGLEGSRFEPDDEIKAKTAEIIKDKKTDEEKVRAIYAFVATNVRYVGVAFGIGRFQPHEATDVLHNQYGDCKDKATLLISMLRAAGFDPDSALIGAGVRMNEAVPSPSAFNHLINRVKVGNEEVWLDATQEVAPYKVLLFQLRDKQALVVPNKGEASLQRTPKNLPFTPLDTWTSKGSMDDKGVADSHIHMSFHSDTEVIIREAIHQVAPAQYEQLGQKFLSSMGFGGTTSHVEFSRPEDTSGPFTFDVDYHREQGGDWPNLKIIPQLPPVGLPRVDDKDPPTRSIDLGAPNKGVSTYEMKLPAGWSAELPEAIHEKARWASYDQTYRFTDGVLYSERTVETFESKVPVSDWKEYKKWQDRASLGFDNYVQLIRPGADGKARSLGTGAGHVSNKDAEDLIRKASDAADKMDVKSAEELLKQAKDLDPAARGLWAEMGYVASLRGKENEAVDDFRKELALYPTNYQMYRFIANSQWRRKQHAEAEETVRQWIAAEPDNPGAQWTMAYDLDQDGKPAEAVPYAKKSVELSGTDEANKGPREARAILLGKVQLKANQTEDGRKTLVDLLNQTDDPGSMNDASYELSVKGLELPLDEKKVREALAKMDAETQSWTLDEQPATLVQKSYLLVATWDTLGWILYKEGKVADAREFILPAWYNQQHDEVKGHLDEIDAKLGNAKLDGGKKALQETRIFPLGSYSGPKAMAEYRLLLAHGKVERDEPTGDKAVGGADGMLKAADFSKLFPKSSNAHLVRTGIVNCTGGKCEIVLEP